MPPSASVSDREDDPDDDEGGPEVDDSEILADLPDDTDVRRSPLHLYENVQSLISFYLRGLFVRPGYRPRTFATEIHILLGSTTIRTFFKSTMFTPEPHQDFGPRSHEGAREPVRVGHVR